MSDLINRQAAIDAFAPYAEYESNRTNAEWVRRINMVLSALPPAQPVAKDINVSVKDCISRQAALDALEKIDCSDGVGISSLKCDAVNDAVTAIKALPPAQPGWIPWDSGRFPEESGTYTVTAYDGATKRVTYAKYQKRLKRWELTGARAYWRVLAWMPLPEPWEGGQNERSD